MTANTIIDEQTKEFLLKLISSEDKVKGYWIQAKGKTYNVFIKINEATSYPN